MKNSINWFEIPVTDFLRAKTFYTAITGSEIHEMPHPEFKYGMLPFDMQAGGVGGAIVQGKGYVPSMTCSLVFLNGGEDLDIALNKVEKAGGKILLPKTSIGPNGFMAQFTDTEGNRIALHSLK